MIPSPDNEYLPPQEEQPAAASLFQLQRYLVFLRRWWWIPLVTLLVGSAVGVAFVLLKEPTFVSKGRMWETMKLRLPDKEIFSDDSQNSIGTQSDVFQSSALREQALARMKASTNSAPLIALDKDRQPLPVRIRVTGSAKSSVFLIEASSANPRYTQAYLDALMEAFLENRKNNRKEISGVTLASISEQVQRWERDLKAAQDALNVFQQTNNLAILQEEGTIAGSYLVKLKIQLSDLQLEMRLLNASVPATNPPPIIATNPDAIARDSSSPPNPAPASAASAETQSSFKEVELLKMQRAKLSQFLRPKHPKIVKLDADIERGQKLQEIFGQQSRDQLAAARRDNQLRIQNVLETIRDWETRVIAANGRIAEAERLKLNIQRLQSVYDRLELLVQNVGFSRNIDQESLSILEPASPVERSYTREISGLALSVVSGFGLGLAIIGLISFRDDRLLSVTEANSKLGDSIVAMLPQIDSANGKGDLTLLTNDDPRHIYAEAYRSLRSALLFLTPENERPKVILITSATPNEGKSTIAANLARMLALGGSRVLLVDADLRKGHLHKLLELESEPGLIELLHKQSEPQAVIQTNSLHNFYFVARGKFSGNPGDLFLDSALEHILARWRQEYDYVVIDSSPLFAADDASCLAAKVDGTLFVVRNYHSSARAVREALDILARRQARVLGLVYNGADASARSYNYYKYPDYYATSKAV